MDINAKADHILKLFLDGGNKFSTDTRNIEKGDIFFALKGANFNGNEFALEALKIGAKYVVVDEEVGAHPQVIQVDDVLNTMQHVARLYRRKFDIPFVAIAGSNGKTTTKELLTHGLAQKYRVHATKGNFNNHIGVPITLLEMPLNTEISVIEIGTNSFGEIATLCEILEPSHGIITNIGKEHLEGFGDIEGVAREESELFNYLMKHDGFTFVNQDDFYLKRMSHRLKQKRSYGFGKDADDHGELIQQLPNIELRLGTDLFSSKLQGIHNAQNILASLCIGEYFNVSIEALQKAISSYTPSNNRSEIKKINSNTFILDAYNANPSSMQVAIESFADADFEKKVILLGDMFEMGDHAKEEHSNIAKLAERIEDVEVMYAGKCFYDVNLGTEAEPRSFTTTALLLDYLKSMKFNDTWFLIKGSRGMKMEEVLKAFEE